MKRAIGLICAVLLAGMLLMGSVSAEHMGIQKTDELEKIQVLQLLEIMNGDQNGDLKLDKTVTRAEFVKMAICASTYKNSAGANSAVSLFPDVTGSHWASGYVSAAIKAGLVSGYLDGTFKPDREVKLEEAVIITLKLLGYTNSDFSGTFPEAQLAKYGEIDLDTDILAKKGDVLTRRECMKLIYNTLCTKTKNGTYYCTTLGYATDSDNTVDYLALLADNVTGPYVYNPSEKLSFDASKTEFFLDGETVSVSALKENDVLYHSKQVGSVWVFRDKVSGVCSGVSPSKEKPSSVIVGGKTYSLSTDKAVYKFSNYGTLGKDMLITLILGKDGDVVDAFKADLDVIGSREGDASYADVVSATLKGPYIVHKDGELPEEAEIKAESAVVYKGSAVSSLEQIKKYNVYYYSKLLNTVWVFDKTVSGTLETVSPNRMTPSSVTVSGKTYSLETSEVQYEFSSLGKYDIGDRVTLLLGRDGAVAGIADTSEINSVVYGVVLTTGEKKYTDADGKSYTADYISVLSSSGDVYSYETTGNYSEGTAVSVTVTNSKVNISKIPKYTNSSQVSSAVNAVKNGMFADNAEIVEYYNSNLYSTVLKSRISGCELGYSDILYCETNADGEITKLILDDYTGDFEEYGYLFVKKREVIDKNNDKNDNDDSNGNDNDNGNGNGDDNSDDNGDDNGDDNDEDKDDNNDNSTIPTTTILSYTYITDSNTEKTYSPEGQISVHEGPARFVMSGGSVKRVYNLKVQKSISIVTDDMVYTDDNKEFVISDNVRVYVREAGKLKVYDIDKLKDGNYTMTAYLDKSPENGGRIRVIVAY